MATTQGYLARRRATTPHVYPLGAEPNADRVMCLTARQASVQNEGEHAAERRLPRREPGHVVADVARVKRAQRHERRAHRVEGDPLDRGAGDTEGKQHGADAV